MMKWSETLFDLVAGYVFLCWICRRPVLARPPRLSWLLDVFVADSEELALYLESLGIEYGRSPSINAPGERPVPRKFSEIVEFSRNRDVHSK